MKKTKIFCLLTSVTIVASTLTGAPAIAQNKTNVETSISAVAANNTLSKVKLSNTYFYSNKKTADIFMRNTGNTQYIYIPYSSGASKSLRPQIQKYNSKTKKWELVTTARTADNGNKTNLRFSYTLSSIKDVGKKDMRVHIPKTSKTAAFTSATSTINFKKESYAVGSFTKSNTSKINFKSSLEYTVNAPKTVSTLNLQKYNPKSKKWVNDKRATFKKNSGNYRQYKFKIYHDGIAGKAQYRLQADANKTHNQYLSKVHTVTFNKGQSKINDSQPIDNNHLSTKTRDKAGFYVTNAPNTTVYMQYYNSKSKKWVNATSVKTKNTTSRQKVLLPYPKFNSGSYKLRVQVQSSKNFNASTSSSRTVNYINPNKYTGVKKNAYNYMKRWCPGVTVETTKFSGSIIGTAYLPEHRIAVHPNLKGNNLKYTAIHECAHVLQLQAFNEDTQNLRERAKKVYGKGNSRGSGMEIQADCIAQYLGGSSVVKYSFYTYGKKCSSSQINAAKKVAQGKKF